MRHGAASTQSCTAPGEVRTSRASPRSKRHNGTVASTRIQVVPDETHTVPAGSSLQGYSCGGPIDDGGDGDPPVRPAPR